MKIRAGLLAAGQGLGLALLSLAVSLTLFILSVLVLAFIPLGVGALLTPAVTNVVRRHANARRRLAREWYGVEIKEPYEPVPEQSEGVIGVMQRCRWILRDPATWRDLLWLFFDSTVGFVVGIFAFALPAYGPYGFVLAAGVWQPIYRHSPPSSWFTFIHITDQASANWAFVVAVGYLLLGIWLSPKLMKAHFQMAGWLLGPTSRQALRLRVERLRQSRSDAVDASAAELRRIERDLHDGAQARLVAMGMSLGAIERLMDKDPEKARILVADARTASVKALSELRDLVRGIHPPVLAERGLGDAVRALALDSTLDAEITADLPGRLVVPVESAAYFAVSEALTNVAKHSGAHQVWVDMRYENGMLHISVTDNGRGGATLGSGLRGIEHRLAAFDGALALSSPPGGPTIVTMEVPCALSSPKTSSS